MSKSMTFRSGDKEGQDFLVIYSDRFFFVLGLHRLAGVDKCIVLLEEGGPCRVSPVEPRLDLLSFLTGAQTGLTTNCPNTIEL